jgi:hypothetical protein
MYAPLLRVIGIRLLEITDRTPSRIVQLLQSGSTGQNIKIENINRNPQRHTRIRN